MSSIKFWATKAQVMYHKNRKSKWKNILISALTSNEKKQIFQRLSVSNLISKTEAKYIFQKLKISSKQQNDEYVFSNVEYNSNSMNNDNNESATSILDSHDLSQLEL